MGHHAAFGHARPDCRSPPPCPPRVRAPHRKGSGRIIRQSVAHHVRLRSSHGTIRARRPIRQRRYPRRLRASRAAARSPRPGSRTAASQVQHPHARPKQPRHNARRKVVQAVHAAEESLRELVRPGGPAAIDADKRPEQVMQLRCDGSHFANPTRSILGFVSRVLIPHRLPCRKSISIVKNRSPTAVYSCVDRKYHHVRPRPG